MLYWRRGGERLTCLGNEYIKLPNCGCQNHFPLFMLPSPLLRSSCQCQPTIGRLVPCILDSIDLLPSPTLPCSLLSEWDVQVASPTEQPLENNPRNSKLRIAP